MEANGYYSLNDKKEEGRGAEWPPLLKSKFKDLLGDEFPNFAALLILIKCANYYSLYDPWNKFFGLLYSP